MPTDNLLTSWIPVIGTLSGAIIGLLASLLIALFNNTSEEKKGQLERTRNRLERLYQLITITTKALNLDVFNIQDSLYEGKKVKKEEYTTEITPLFEIKMIIDLYFPELESNRSIFMERHSDFSEVYVELENEHNTENKEKYFQQLLKTHDNFRKESDSFLKKISTLINP